MSKKQIVVPLVSFLLGASTVWLSSFSITDMSGVAPSYTAPLTDQEFTAAQEKGEVTFNGSPTTKEGGAYNIEMFVHCRREVSECAVASTIITDYTSGPGLSTELKNYKITEWSDEGNITAVLEPKENDCGTYGLRADVKSREIFVNYKIKEGVNKDVCENLQPNGETKLDFNMAEGTNTILSSLKSDIQYALGELFQ
jgi:hypothetical protein